MKKITLLFLLLSVLAACDNPRSRRVKMTESTENAYTNDSDSGFNFNDSSSSGSTTTDSNIPSDATHCKFSSDGVSGFESTSTHLGAYTLCQSSTDKNVFYIQIKTPPVASTGDVNVCFIPQTTSGSTSIYVGNPMCSTFPDPKTVKKITFVKFTEYTNALINSVMFFKDTSYYYSTYGGYYKTLEAYGICMTYLAKGVTKYCENFKSVGQYVLKSF